MIKKPNPTSITTHTGLRITSEKIELTITSKTTISKYLSIPLEPDTIQNGEIANPEKLKTALQQLLKQRSTFTKFITLGVPEHSVFIKSIQIKENLPNTEILAKIIQKTEKYFPLPSENMYIDWRWISDSKQTIQLVAIPKTVLDTYLSILNSLNLIPLAVESTSMSLSRLIKDIKLSEPALIIDADTTTTLLVLEPDHSCNLSAISQSSTPSKLSSSLKQVINDLIQFYPKKYKQPIKKIFFTGALQNQLSPFLPKEIPSELVTHNNIEASQTIGYALAQMPVAHPEDPHTINLIPPNIQANYDQVASHNLQKKLLIISIGFLLILNIINGGFLFQTLKQQSSLPQPENPPSENANLLSQISTVNKQAEVTLQILNQKRTFSQILNQIINTLPSNITITYIKMDATNQFVTIRGFANTQEEVLDFKDQLEQTPEFYNVNLPFSVLEKSQDLNFSLSLNWTTEQKK